MIGTPQDRGILVDPTHFGTFTLMLKEANLMKSLLVATCLIAFGASYVGSQVLGAQKLKGQGEVVGAIWQFEAKETAKKNASVIQAGRFRATLDGRIYTIKGRQVGTYKYMNKGHDKVQLNITEGKLKGKIDLLMVGINSPTYQGTLTREDGSKAHMALKMIKD